MDRVKVIQAFVASQLYTEVPPEFTDVEEWKTMQQQLSVALTELEALKGNTLEEEAELVLTILMGHCISVRNSYSVSQALERAECVMPLLADPVLKCKLACFCYLEFPDEELLQVVHSCIAEVKQQGRGEEILQVEKMISDI